MVEGAALGTLGLLLVAVASGCAPYCTKLTTEICAGRNHCADCEASKRAGMEPSGAASSSSLFE